MPSPSLAIARIGQQFVYQVLIGFGRGVVQKRAASVGVGGIPTKIGVHAAQQGAILVAGGGGFQAFRFQFGQNESVNRVLHPGGIFHFRHGGHDNAARTASPVSFIYFRALIDPRFDEFDLRVRNGLVVQAAYAAASVRAGRQRARWRSHYPAQSLSRPNLLPPLNSAVVAFPDQSHWQANRDCDIRCNALSDKVRRIRGN